MQLKATKLAEEGKISELRLQTICNALSLIRDRANNIMSTLNWDEPPPYVSVIDLGELQLTDLIGREGYRVGNLVLRYKRQGLVVSKDVYRSALAADL
jgi:hypothetical protein